MLQGKKVLLRSVRRDEVRREWEFHNDVEFTLLTGGDPWEPQSLDRLEAQYEENVHRNVRDGPHFAIEADGVFIGTCGLFHFDFNAMTCEIGIGIGDRNYWGLGYGRDAIQVLLDYAFRLRNFRRVWLTVNGNNERAQRAYRACGFREEGRLRSHVYLAGQYVDLIHMGLLREEWTSDHVAATDPQQ